MCLCDDFIIWICFWCIVSVLCPLSALVFWPYSAQKGRFWTALANWHLKLGEKDSSFMRMPKFSRFLIIAFLALLLNFLFTFVLLVWLLKSVIFNS